MSHAFGEGRIGLMRTLWGGSLKLVHIFIYPLAGAMIVLATPAILLVYGEDYLPGALPVLVLTVYLLVRPIGIMSTRLTRSSLTVPAVKPAGYRTTNGICNVVSYILSR